METEDTKTNHSHIDPSKGLTSMKKAPIAYQRGSNIFIVLFIAINIITIFNYRPGYLLEARMQSPINFAFRDYIKQSPPLSDRLKILVLDDQSVSFFKMTDISLRDYGLLIENLSKSGASKIFIDKVFGLISEDHKADLAFFREMLEKSAPVIVGSYSTSRKILHREQLPDHHLYQLEDDGNGYDWLHNTRGKLYGPDRVVRDIFSKIGHIDLKDKKVFPVRRLAQDKVVPHMALFASDSFEITKSGLFVDGKEIPLNRFGAVPVNFPSLEELYQSSISLKSLIHRSRKGKNLVYNNTPLINDGDIIMVIPLYFTGNVDLQETVIGTIPGGFVPASLINSVLTKEWLTPINPYLSGFLILLGSVVGGLLGIFFGSVMFGLLSLTFMTATILLGLLSFSYYSLEVPWLFVAFSQFMSGIIVFGNRAHAREQNAKQLRHALSGLVPPDKLQKIMNHPLAIRRDASENLVTLMFIDIVGFSVVAEQKPPKEVFMALRDLMTDFTKAVHDYGGIVDRTLGDGMLCFFGYSYAGEVDRSNHADSAIECAIEIQKQNLMKSLQKFAQNDLSFPVRIGINTASVYIGDIGNQDRVDFTLIGDGVNFAKRLETACEPFMVAMSSSTFASTSQQHKYVDHIEKRQFKVKHHDNTMEAYELNPFADDTESLQQAQKITRSIQNFERRSVRWPVNDPTLLECKSDFGLVEIIDFSSTGMLISLDTYLSQGVNFNLEINDKDGTLKEFFHNSGFDHVPCEVRWGRPVGDKYVHGISFTNLHNHQRKALIKGLKDSLRIAS